MKMAKKKISTEQIANAEAQLQSLQKQVEYDTKDYTLELLLSKFERGDFSFLLINDSIFGSPAIKHYL